MAKKEYANYGFRLSEETMDLLKLIKKYKGESWNLFVNLLIKEHINNTKQLYAPMFKKVYSQFRKEKCEECNAESTNKPGGYLCVHHIDGDITNNKEDNLKTLCNRCHGKQYPR